MKIAVLSAFYSEGMGYSENCLPKALAKLGHDVHVLTSTYNVYGNQPLYDVTYGGFLGPRQVAVGTRVIDGYSVHRLNTRLLSGQVSIAGLSAKVRQLDPDIVHSLEIASVLTFRVAALKPFARFKLFAETHQHMSVMRPYMRHPTGDWVKRAAYRVTRTVPSFLASLTIEACYAIAPDCAEVARRFYGVPESKVRLSSLGSDTDVFHPVETDEDRDARRAVRDRLGYVTDDIVCVYTGRLTQEKNPLVLATAIGTLARDDPRYKGLFFGDGAQKAEIAACRNTTVMPFITHTDLAQIYRAADIGVWPRQESMSMIDAAASGLPIVVSNRIGETGRVTGNGRMFEEDDVGNLATALSSLASEDDRHTSGAVGRFKVLESFSWDSVARRLEVDFMTALEPRRVRV